MSIPTEITWFDPWQMQLVMITERAAAGVSSLGCLFVFVTFACSKRFHRPVNRLLFYAAIGNMCMNAAALISLSGITMGGILCEVQGFLVQMFLPTDVLWKLAMAINTYLTVFKNYDAQRLRKLEIFYNLFIYGITLGLSLAYCFISTPTRGKIYGPATMWCWVSEPWYIFRIGLLYGPVWIAIVICISIYLAVGVSIFRKRNQLREFRHSGRRTVAGLSSLTLNFVPNSINRTTEVRTTSVLRDNDLDEKILAEQYHCSAEALPKNPFAGETDLPSQSQNPAMEANAAAWGYTKAAVLFFVVLLVTWGPASVFLAFSIFRSDLSNFPLTYATSLLLPLQGFWNAVIYIIVAWEPFKAWLRDIGKAYGSTSPNDNKSTFSHAGTLQGHRLSDDSAQDSSDGNAKPTGGKVDAFESLYGMTGTGTPKLPPVGHRSQSSLGLHDRMSFDNMLGEQRFTRTSSVRSARNTADNHFERSGSVRSARQASTRMRASSSQGRRPPSIVERPGTAPEMYRSTEEELGVTRILGLVELPTATTPRAPSSPSPP